MEATKLLDTVIKLLLKHPHYRNDDTVLCAGIWWYDVRNAGYNPDRITATNFLTLYTQGKITTGESITRARRKAQELRPDLRGEAWEDRHKAAQEAADRSRLPYKD